MAVTPKIKTPVDLKTLGPIVDTHHGSTIHSNIAMPGVAAATVRQPGGLPVPIGVNKGDAGPLDNPSAFYVTRNNRVLGPFVDLRMAQESVRYIEQRELEIGTDI